MIAPFTRGVGAIFTLHHVSPRQARQLRAQPRSCKVTPQFLEQVIQQVRAAGFEIVSLDEAHFRLVEGEYGRPFVCFTFDDGYRDNLEHAYPIFQRYDLPFAIYVPTDYPDGHGELWWLALERVDHQGRRARREDRRRRSGASGAARRPRRTRPSTPSTGGCR